MRALLDTNIIIYRETSKQINENIMNLYYWLDKLHCDKVIHQDTTVELGRFYDVAEVAVFNNKLLSYHTMKSRVLPTEEFMSILSSAGYSIKKGDTVDNAMLYEVSLSRVDYLITEDKRSLNKATVLGIKDKVFSIGEFITKCTEENPDFKQYKELKVKKIPMGTVDVNDRFFDTLKSDYKTFTTWFHKKCDDDVYVSYDQDKVQGFLSLKLEDTNEVYDIEPRFDKMLRLKIRTFKVNSTGFRLGERFLKIVFDHALMYNVDQIYVTMFDKQLLGTFYNFLLKWGFILHGRKTSSGEIVLIKNVKFNPKLNPTENFPLFDRNANKFFLPIEPKYHKALFADSTLKREEDFGIDDQMASRYAIKKAYISWAYSAKRAKPGDIIYIYRKGVTTPKRYSSTITSIAIVNEVITNFKSEADFLRDCENRSVFPEYALKSFWRNNSRNISIIKLLYLKPLSKNATLNDLIQMGMYNYNEGPRPFDKINDDSFDELLRITNTKL